MINNETSMAEVAAIVSAAPGNSDRTATSSCGAAVTIFSDNTYESADPDFVTFECIKNGCCRESGSSHQHKGQQTHVQVKRSFLIVEYVVAYCLASLCQGISLSQYAVTRSQ